MLCAKCDSDISDGTKCSMCLQELCFGCSGVTEKGYRNLGANRQQSWKCPSCKASPQPAPQSEPSKQSVSVVSMGSLEEVLRKVDAMAAKLDCLPKLVEDVGVMKSEMMLLKESYAKLEGVSDVIHDLNQRISGLEALKEDLAAARTEIDTLKQDYINKDQWSRMNNVEIKGIPFKNDENLFDIVEVLGKHVNYLVPKSQINYVSRIPVYNSKDKSILLSFVNRCEKEDFVAAARAKKTIPALDLGLSKEKQDIYVNDHLTPQNKLLLNKAKALTKERGYKYIWVKYAKIHVRKNENSPPLVISSAQDLNKIL